MFFNVEESLIHVPAQLKKSNNDKIVSLQFIWINPIYMERGSKYAPLSQFF